jgi:hypothetical protein
MADWPWSWPHSVICSGDFPNLIYGENANHKRTSWATQRYNCIAWAAGEVERPWWPQRINAYWPPPPAIDAETLPAFISAYGSRGYSVCLSADLELGVEKIAIYVDHNNVPTHAARQLRSGQWTSKLGNYPDIRHEEPIAVSGPLYGSPACYMSRPFPNVTMKDRWSRLTMRSRTIGHWLVYFVKCGRAFIAGHELPFN